MQLRSGKNIQTVSVSSNDSQYNLRFYGECNRVNITMTMDNEISSSKPSTPIIAKHSMTLRPRKSEVSHLSVHLENLHINCNHELFRDWLIARLKGFIEDFHKINNRSYKKLVLERSQLFVEMTAVLYDHIDYITSSGEFVKFSHVLYSKLCEFIREITDLLNVAKQGTYGSCNFSYNERTFLGNVRADIVKLSVIMKSRLPMLVA
uniref:Uncharacterized protein n=1 Tax=viral metagenome TaxID=1070528 RepID=A0A6C0JXF1_9ZZZZ